MVSHQRSCAFSTDNPKDSNSDSQHQQQNPKKRPSLEITAVKNGDSSSSPVLVAQPPPEKRLKIVLNGESLKEFVMSKDLSEERRQDPPQLTVVPIQIGTVDNNNIAGKHIFFKT